MILTVTLNTAVDKTYTVENFRIDRVHRPSAWRVVPGGKGINVARVYRELGGDAVATGFLGGHNGDHILEGLKAEGLKADFVPISGESRVCIAILDPIEKTQTELNEIGPQISNEELESLKSKYEGFLSGVEYVVLSGSTPPGVPDTIYRELIEAAHRHNVRCILDTSGEPLAQGLLAKPWMAKPNVHELSAVVGRQLTTIEETTDAAAGFNERGIQMMMVTLGRDGALVSTNDGVWWGKPPEIPFISAVGSGDAAAAAFVYSVENGGTAAEALKLAVGAGAANAMTFGAGFCKRDDILQLARQVEVSRLRGTAE